MGICLALERAFLIPFYHSLIGERYYSESNVALRCRGAIRNGGGAIRNAGGAGGLKSQQNGTEGILGPISEEISGTGQFEFPENAPSPPFLSWYDI